MVDDPTSQAADAPAGGGGFTSGPEGTPVQPRTPEQPAPTAPTPQPQAPDYAALDEQYRALGDGYSIETGISKIQDLKRGMSDAQTRASTIEKRYEVAEPLIGHLDGTPGFADYMQEKVNEFFRKDEYEAPSPQAAPVAQAFDQGAWKLQKIEQQLASIEQNRQLDELSRQYPNAMTVETRQEIANRMSQSGGSADQHLFAIQGQAMMQQARQDGADSSRSNVGYRPAPSGTYTPPPVKPVTQMEKRELDDHQESRIDQIIKGPS